MQQSQEMSGEEKEVLKETVNESLGNPEKLANSAQENPNDPENDELPEYAKKRIGMQEKRHKKELRRMQQQLDELHSRVNAPQESSNFSNSSMPEHADMNDNIRLAVEQAMKAQEMKEQKQRAEQNAQHIYRKEQDFAAHLDKASDKYEDFDDVVRAQDAPYTEAMKGMAMVLHNIPGIDVSEVLYQLGKDKDKLKDFSKKHSIDQAHEFAKLAIAMAIGKDKPNSANQSRPLGQIKNNPITSQQVSENTSVGDLRKRMRDGGKKWA